MSNKDVLNDESKEVLEDDAQDVSNNDTNTNIEKDTKEIPKEKARQAIKNVAKKEGKFIKEFKEFALKGNVIDLAVGVLIGGAFQSVVTSLTNNIISPILGLFGGVNFSEYSLKIGKLNLAYGAFFTDIINFIIMAFVIFLIVKFINKLSNIGHKEEVIEVTTKICPHCQSEINIKADRCPHCTSKLEIENKNE